MAKIPHGATKYAVIVTALLAAIGQGGHAAFAPASGQVVVKVRVTLENDRPLPAIIQERIEASIGKVAERLVLGRPVSQVQEQKDAYRQIMRDVFAKVLRGYCLENLELNVGAEVEIKVRLSAEEQTVSRVNLSTVMPGLSSASALLLGQDFDGIRDACEQALIGLPVASLSWTGPLLAPMLLDKARQEFPGFQIGVDIQPGEAANLQFTLVAQRPLAEKVQTEITTVTLPRVYAVMWQKRINEHAAAYRDLPVAYLRRRQLQFEQDDETWLEALPASSRLNLRWDVSIYPGAVTRVRYALEAGGYSLTLHGQLDITEPVTFGLTLNMGIRPFAGLELAGGMQIDTGGEGLAGAFSLSYSLNEDLDLGATYNTRDRGRYIWLRYASEHGDLFILSGDFFRGKYAASIGLMQENAYALTFTADSDRQYHLTFDVGF